MHAAPSHAEQLHTVWLKTQAPTQQILLANLLVGRRAPIPRRRTPSYTSPCRTATRAAASAPPPPPPPPQRALIHLHQGRLPKRTPPGARWWASGKALRVHGLTRQRGSCRVWRRRQRTRWVRSAAGTTIRGRQGRWADMDQHACAMVCSLAVLFPGSIGRGTLHRRSVALPADGWSCWLHLRVRAPPAPPAHPCPR